MDKNAVKFYVYTLSHDGWVFYVGKGSGQRMDSHRYLAEKGANLKLYDFIRELWAEGGDYEAARVFETDDEEEALTHEQRLIDEYGIDNLLNASPNNTGPRKRTPRPVSTPIALEPPPPMQIAPPASTRDSTNITPEAWDKLIAWSQQPNININDFGVKVREACNGDVRMAAHLLLGASSLLLHNYPQHAVPVYDVQDRLAADLLKEGGTHG